MGDRKDNPAHIKRHGMPDAGEDGAMIKPRLKLVRCYRGEAARNLIADLSEFGERARVHRIPAGPLKGCVTGIEFGSPPWSVFRLAKARGPVLEFKVCIRVGL